ncbi:MAG: ABC transporter permease [Saccharofermentans sp.]|nr:ABC transporter permease [Saccharofermentans sp.]
MFLRILKKDLKRRKTINIIMVLFVILASMFVSSGLNNVITVANGTDYYLDQAGVGDYVVLTRDSERNCLDDILDSTDAISSYAIENIVMVDSRSLYDENDEILENSNSILVQSYEDSKLNFFDINNQTPEALTQGHCYITGSFIRDNNLSSGDCITLKAGNTEIELIVDGFVKDAFLGSDFMGNTRVLINSEDLRTLEDDEFNLNMFGQVCYIFSDDVDAVNAAFSSVDNLMFSAPRSMIKMAYVMDMIVAFVVLILSVCLMIVSFVVLKFVINLTITEEYHEIGVMKAIGISNFKIRSLYIIKYLIIAIVGSIVGLLLSFPFGELLIKSVTEKMVLGNSFGCALNIVGSLVVILSIVAFAYASTSKIKKATPVDAIRSGQTGERYSRKSALKLRKFKANIPSFMAINDILSNPKRYMSVVVAFAFCTMFVLILVNTVSTMKSDSFIDTFASRSDLYVTLTQEEDKEATYGYSTREQWEQFFDRKEQELEDLGMPSEIYVDFQYQCPVTVGEEEYMISCQQGFGTTMDDYAFYEGVAPSSPDEIAITPQIAEKLGVEIGDTVTINYGLETRNVTVSAYFQTMNQLGELIRIHEDAKTDISRWSSKMAFQVNFLDNPSKEEIIRRADELEGDVFFDCMTSEEYQIECLGVVPTMEAVQYLLLAITLLVVIFVTVLMERSFISDETKEIAILKAIGFKNSRIISWQVIRFGIVAFIAAVIAAALSVPMTHLCITPIFGMMGASNVDYVIDPLKILLIYPAIIVAMTVIVSFFTSLVTYEIKSSNTANIE